jgi:hypothetical protein
MWFEIAITAILLLFGQVLFSHFEEKTPRWRQLLKMAIAIVLFPLVSYLFGNFWFWIALVIAAIPSLIIHLWWLPRHGINGWTGEPKDKYYELRGWKTKS